MLAARLDPARLHVFTDFDGTITQPDTLQVLTEHLGGGAEFYRETGRLLWEEKLSLREALLRDMETIRAPFSVATEVLRAQVMIDPGFALLARWCAACSIPLTILSAGFHEIVDLFISPGAYPGVEVRANRFEPGTWRCVFRDESAFGYDKAEALRVARGHGRETVFIGDGFSDWEPARVADLVFAKRGRNLEAYCRSRGLAYRPFDGLEEVVRDLQGGAP